jgi:hypothetical protein
MTQHTDRCYVTVAMILLAMSASAQIDTTRYGWPVEPFFGTHPITGTFCEFRNTLSSNHFHNGVDIPMPDGTPVYAVLDGIITTIGTVAANGDNAYVRVRDDAVYNGVQKTDAYVHIAPNPLLYLGERVVAHQTILGNILPGLGHVHYIEGPSGYEINAIRPVGGLTPYIDVYPPDITSVRFFVDETDMEFQHNQVSGPVDIRVQVRETNAAGPWDVRSSTTNNGTYAVGYKVLSADLSTVVYEPPSAGWRYRFYLKPSNAYVDRVFASGSDLSTHIYTITNGYGADYINSTQVVHLNSWNTEILLPGSYVVMIFTEDAVGLADTAYVPVQVRQVDRVPPASPVLQQVVNDSTRRFTVAWAANTDPDLLGYRLYFSADGVSWNLKETEDKLGPSATSISYSLSSSGVIFFRLVAVDSAAPPNYSVPSSVYGIRLNSSGTRTLVVDGSGRFDSSQSAQAPHSLALIHGQSIPFDFSTCAREMVVGGKIALQDFQVVDWFLGGDSTDSPALSAEEQALLQSYLKEGGQLVLGGTDLASDLDGPVGPTQADRGFLHEYLKAAYAGGNTSEHGVIGAPTTAFSDVNFRFGVASEGSPVDIARSDLLSPSSGAMAALHYGAAPSIPAAAVAFKGLFPDGAVPGAVVYFGFPFETITTKAGRDTLMRRVFQFFNLLTSAGPPLADGNQPERFDLKQNYPNPFNPTTEIRFTIPVGTDSYTSLRVYDLLGREVVTLVNERESPGNHQIEFDAAGLPSGMYIYRLEAGPYVQQRKMVLVK